MSAKHALIVDDSESARTVLAQTLEQYAIGVDMAESAEEALEYLKTQRPDAIFMDHQMPGMDGLQAVRIIKNDPRTATIPIIMYTSQEGELYVGQARALGAVGVLPKKVVPTEVSKVLYQLHLVPDRRDPRPSVLQPVPLLADVASAAAPAVGPGVAGAFPPHAWAGQDRQSADARAFERDVQAAVAPLLRAQLVELRRLVAASVDLSAATPLAGTHDTAVDSHAEPAAGATGASGAALAGPAESAEPAPVPPAVPPARPIAWMMFSAMAIGALLLAVSLLWRQGRELDGLRARVADAERAAAVADARAAERTASYEAARNALQALAGAAPGAGAAGGSADATLAQRVLNAAALAGVDVPRVVPVAYGETPLAGARLEVLRALAASLEQRGASGTLRVTTHAADFCLTGNPTEGYSLAPDDLPAKSCDVAGNPHDDALRGPQRESRAFADFVAALPNRSHGALSIVTREAGRTKPLVAYPAAAEASAGQWNAAASANQRVEISFTARAAPP